MADESKGRSPRSVEIVRSIQQFPNGRTVFFASTLRFDGGLLVDVTPPAEKELYPIGGDDPPAADAKPAD